MCSEGIKGFRFTRCLMFLLSVATGLCALKAQSEVLRDPTQPLNYVVQVASGEAELKLESVLISSGRRLATINGQTVSVDQSVSGAKVISIVAGSVTVIAKGQRQELFVSKPLNMMKKVRK